MPNGIPSEPWQAGMGLTSELTADVHATSVELTYRVSNTGDEVVTHTFRSGKRYDLVVRSPDTDEPCWRASEGRAYTMAIESVTLSPGDSKTFTETIDTLTDGTYFAEASLATPGGAAPASVRFAIG